MSTIRNVACSGWRYARNGNPGKVLQYERYRLPFDRQGADVVVKMLAAPVHRHDKSMIEGVYGGIRPAKFPAVGGVEGVGVVEEIGSRATVGLKEGDLVWVNNPKVGTWATRIVTDCQNLDVVPNRTDIDIEHLASLSAFHTAYHLTNSFVSLQPGDVVLQTGATSAVSQICQGYIRARGAKLFQTMQMGRTDGKDQLGYAKLRGAFAVVPYSYARTNYMRRLLSDLPPPKLLLNGTCGRQASLLVKLLGDNGTCVTYGSVTGKPMQIANMDAIQRGIKFRGFFLPAFLAAHSREHRMRVHQQVVESMTISQGHGVFRAQRFRMDGDSPFAFSNAWDAPLASRKAVLRMVGEYGEWRKPRSDTTMMNVATTVWDDLIQETWESSVAHENPKSMKYYTPFDDANTKFYDPKAAKELGFREVFFKRPNMPRNNASESQS